MFCVFLVREDAWKLAPDFLYSMPHVLFACEKHLKLCVSRCLNPMDISSESPSLSIGHLTQIFS